MSDIPDITAPTLTSSGQDAPKYTTYVYGPSYPGLNSNAQRPYPIFILLGLGLAVFTVFGITWCIYTYIRERICGRHTLDEESKNDRSQFAEIVDSESDKFVGQDDVESNGKYAGDIGASKQGGLGGAWRMFGVFGKRKERKDMVIGSPYNVKQYGGSRDAEVPLERLSLSGRAENQG